MTMLNSQNSDGLTLRTATQGDFDAVDALFRRSYPALLKADYKPSVMVTALPLISRAQPGLLASGSFLVAEHEGHIVSAGGWTMEAPGGRPGQRGIGHVRHVVTDPKHVRKGFARRLMRQVMLQAFASGMVQMHCQSTLTAVPFYASLGFVEKGEIDVALQEGIVFPAVFMTADLQVLSAGAGW